MMSAEDDLRKALLGSDEVERLRDGEDPREALARLAREAGVSLPENPREELERFARDESRDLSARALAARVLLAAMMRPRPLNEPPETTLARWQLEDRKAQKRAGRDAARRMGRRLR